MICTNKFVYTITIVENLFFGINKIIVLLLVPSFIETKINK